MEMTQNLLVTLHNNGFSHLLKCELILGTVFTSALVPVLLPT